VQTGPAQLALLDQGHRQAQLGSPQGAGVTATATAQDDDVEHAHGELVAFSMAPEASLFPRLCDHRVDLLPWHVAGATTAMVPPTGTSSLASTTSARTTPDHVDSSGPSILSCDLSDVLPSSVRHPRKRATRYFARCHGKAPLGMVTR